MTQKAIHGLLSKKAKFKKEKYTISTQAYIYIFVQTKENVCEDKHLIVNSVYIKWIRMK